MGRPGGTLRPREGGGGCTCHPLWGCTPLSPCIWVGDTPNPSPGIRDLTPPSHPLQVQSLLFHHRSQ